MAKVTRTSTKAHVAYERVYKDEKGKVQTDHGDVTLDKCDTRDKAEIMLQKEFKGSLVSVLNITFVQETRGMTEQAFLEHSEIIKTEEVSEEELLAKAESRKRIK